MRTSHKLPPNKSVSATFWQAINENDIENLQLIFEKHPRLTLVNKWDGYGRTPLILAISRYLMGGNTNVIHYLISKDADVNFAVRDPENPHQFPQFPLTPLHLAQNSKTVINILIQAGAIDTPTSDGNYLIHRSAGGRPWESDKLAIVQILLKNQPELLNVMAKNGMTPLCYAVNAGNTEVAQYLIAEGAEINFIVDNPNHVYPFDFHGKTLLDIARERQDKVMIGILTQAAETAGVTLWGDSQYEPPELEKKGSIVSNVSGTMFYQNPSVKRLEYTAGEFDWRNEF